MQHVLLPGGIVSPSAATKTQMSPRLPVTTGSRSLLSPPSLSLSSLAVLSPDCADILSPAS